VDIIASSRGTLGSAGSGSSSGGDGESTDSNMAAGMCLFVCLFMAPVFISSEAMKGSNGICYKTVTLCL